MRKFQARLVGAAAAVGLATAAIAGGVMSAGNLVSAGVLGSSHREAPRIMLDPSADNTDIYAFALSDGPSRITAVASWVSMENPAGGPYFSKLEPQARYIHIDKILDFVQSYDLYYATYRTDLPLRLTDVTSDLQAAPDNIKLKSVPANARDTSRFVAKASGGVASFAGPRDEPFYVDLHVGLDAISTG
ncbi:MAG TPA: DUF4331 family protein [Actinophytocola sp.]|uniref:DUF4331 family protein n=1 Tax=Actinophytocola sp. TaxID=1872138 RepID=UPI002F93D607